MSKRAAPARATGNRINALLHLSFALVVLSRIEGRLHCRTGNQLLRIWFVQLYELQFVRTEIPVKREPFRKGVKKRSCVTLVRTKIAGTVNNLILKSIWNLHKSQASLPEILYYRFSVNRFY